jgi:type II secretory pathway pseudopilin PulG
MRRMRGFTIFEMVIVIIMVGLLTAGLSPLVVSSHTRSMENDERAALRTAKEALIAYALTNGGLPPHWAPAATDALLPTLPGAWAPATHYSFFPTDAVLAADNRPATGVAGFGSYRKAFWYDPRHELRADYGAVGLPVTTGYVALNTSPTPQKFCSNVRTALASLPPFTTSLPQVCRLPQVGEETTACPGGAAAVSPVAFVLASFGNDRQPNKAHASLDLTAPVRQYENPARATNHSAGSGVGVGDTKYDDMVFSVSLSELAQECEKTVEASVCPGSEKFLSLINADNTSIRYKLGAAGACTELSSKTSVALSCVDPATANLALFNNATCVGGGTAVSLTDTNTDGRVDVLATSWNNAVSY